MVDKPTIGPPALYAAGLQARVWKDQAKMMDRTYISRRKMGESKKDGKVEAFETLGGDLLDNVIN